MLRILPQEIVNAYRGKGLTLGTGSILYRRANPTHLFACGLGAIAFKPGDEAYCDNPSSLPDDWETLYERVNKKYGESYVDGFVPGFDGHEPPTGKHVNERMLEGYADGQACIAAARNALE